eukprot:CAMPEP_0172623222 /NCGR_PEP_ID=MMETSP1068-20121228/126724_1 /TAXON_ID=35684 /ORGANISM="Pseudopedinella elastica, Strain CCMP716" /LENGTH=57 /DNA_ID=CAMNT_0013431689 /DNA_START=8 /DNA_END=177 /DNA_ORIENTATION=+
MSSTDLTTALGTISTRASRRASLTASLRLRAFIQFQNPKPATSMPTGAAGITCEGRG